MPRIPARFGHYLFGIIQSGLTTGLSTAIASDPFGPQTGFLRHWLQSWGVSWLVMLPVVILAAPAIRAFVARLTAQS